MDITSYLLGKKNGGVTPTGEVDINANGVHNVSGYATANVQVPQPSGTINIIENGTTDVTNYETANVNVPVPVQEKDVNFYDYDGTLLYSYTLAEAQNLTELPAGPTHEGLTFQEWNWDLADIKAENDQVDVGATYISSDGKTRVYIELQEGALTPVVGLEVNGSVEIDWGDGSAVETYTTTDNKTHTYSQAGQYVVTFNPLNNATFNPRQNNYYSVFFSKLTYSTGSTYYQNYPYWNSIKKIIIGQGFSFGSVGFQYCANLKRVNIPSHITTLPPSFLWGANTDVVIVPRNVTTIGGNFATRGVYKLILLNSKDITFSGGAFSYGGVPKLRFYKSASYNVNGVFIQYFDVKEIIFKGNFTVQYFGMGQNCNGTKKITITSALNPTIGGFSATLKKVEGDLGTTIVKDFFNGCSGLESIPSLTNVETIGDNAFNGCQGLAEIDLGSKLKSIGNTGFQNCWGLTKMTFPATLTTIGNNAFAYNRAMAIYDFSACTQIPTAGTTIFNYNDSLQKIIVPDALYEDWIVASNWSSYANKIVKASEA